MSPFVYALSLESWQLFATLTFESRGEDGQPLRVPPYEKRLCMLFGFLRDVAEGLKRNHDGKRIEKVHFTKLVWAARDEPGELNGREHFHVLINGLPLGRRNATDRWVTKHIWRNNGGGHADIRSFDTSLSGVRYILKGLDQWSLNGANAYELGKFSEGEERKLILSHALLKKWNRECMRAKASEGTANTDYSGLSLSDRRKLVANRTKETPAYAGGLYAPNMHPAGVSFVR